VPELEAAAGCELVELTHAVLGVLATRPAPQCPLTCLELAERLGAALDLVRRRWPRWWVGWTLLGSRCGSGTREPVAG
jgi:hypothetical protein